MLEFSGSLRLAPGYLYFPPRPLKARAVAAYRQTVDELIHWLYEALGQLNRGTIPFLFLDLNDAFARLPPSLDGQAEGQDDQLGPFNHGEEHYAGQQLRRLCYEVGLAVTNTFAQHAHTFYPPGRGQRAQVSRLHYYSGRLPSPLLSRGHGLD